MGHITVTLKLHRPSRIKQSYLQTATDRYAQAFHWLLTQAGGQLEAFHAQSEAAATGLSSRQLRLWVDKGMGLALNRFGVEPFKDSLKNDFAAWMAGYLARREQEPGLRFNPPRQRAVLFCRYDTKRDWCLVYNPETDRFYAKLYLTNREGSLPNAHRDQSRLVHVHRDRMPLCDNLRVVRYLLFPLAFGKRQEMLLKQAVASPERFRCARLLYRNGAWYLACSLEMAEVPPVHPVNRIGFSRAMQAAFSYTVTGPDARVIAGGLEPLPPHAVRDNGSWTANALHHVANRMAALALGHNARAVVAPLVRKGDHLHWVDAADVLHGPPIDGSHWNRILGLLRYKLPMRGLPAPVQVSPNNMFRTCPQCGRASPHNRMNKLYFLCVDCGHSQALDTLGSLNLAMRLFEYEKDRKRANANEPSAQQTSHHVPHHVMPLQKATVHRRPSQQLRLIPSRISR